MPEPHATGDVAAGPDDITRLILDHHEQFRREFALLDELQAAESAPAADLARVWEPLADLLDVHAIAEEEIFYPQLLRKGDDAREETLDAIGDHNDIRDAVHDAARQPTGSDAWWQAVGRARVANDEHMAEEEREGLADFRRNAASGLREALGRRFREFTARHQGARDLDTSDKDPERYVEGELPSPPTGDSSLGIGSLKGR
ncbi:hemerythrin domain-containing protein [Pseudonocardia spinosispora]|uniref:hemerythrin domain-containing protein n=1 Tax=Pseudonocardia spinosispora TaxID=103441 RepID=UPI0003F5DED3|nr:hemerythrin domain-containing protein [Pseudonocardia spinosispora]